MGRWQQEKQRTGAQVGKQLQRQTAGPLVGYSVGARVSGSTCMQRSAALPRPSPGRPPRSECRASSQAGTCRNEVHTGVRTRQSCQQPLQERKQKSSASQDCCSCCPREPAKLRLPLPRNGITASYCTVQQRDARHGCQLQHAWAHSTAVLLPGRMCHGPHPANHPPGLPAQHVHGAARQQHLHPPPVSLSRHGQVAGCTQADAQDGLQRRGTAGKRESGGEGALNAESAS